MTSEEPKRGWGLFKESVLSKKIFFKSKASFSQFDNESKIAQLELDFLKS